MPITLPGIKLIYLLAAVIAGGFAVAAVWQEFGSRGEPGENEFADAAMQQIKDQGGFHKGSLRTVCNGRRQRQP